MALIAPVAGALVGGVATGFSTWGMATGWLIGSWLFGKKADDDNRIFDPGAEEMPRINQALRGVTMPVTFGTNRISSNVVWQKNFTTIRHEKSQGGGGGKGGGSGLGSKGGGTQTTNASYEYKWDLLFHLGMSDEPVSLFGGWLANERLDDATLNAIINNSGGGFNQFFRSNVARPNNASLSFDEGFFYGATATDDTDADNWDYFENQEGGPYRWPFTYYVGFKQLNLGASARMPQLSWEVGPGDVNLEFTGGAIDYWDSASLTDNTGGRGTAASVIIGKNGKLYQIDATGGSSNVFKVRNTTDQVDVLTKTTTQFDADATALGLDPGDAYTFTAGGGANIVPGKNLIIAWGQDIGFASRSNYAFIIYEVDENGSVVTVGGYQGRSNTLEGPDDDGSVSVFGEGTDSDPIVLIANSSVGASDDLHLFKIPSINEMKGILIEDTASNNFQTRTQNLRSLVTEIANKFGDHESYRGYPQGAFGFVLNTVTVGMTGAIWKSKIMWYIGRADIQWHDDNPGSSAGTQTIYDLVGSYPSGGIWSTGIEIDTDQTFTVSNEFVDEAANFIGLATNTSVLPFDDAGFDEDGNTQDANDYDPIPQLQQLKKGASAGATLIIFWKNTPANSNDRLPTGAWTKARVFIWNPLKQVAVQYGVADGNFVDTVDDWGYPEPSRNTYSIGTISGYYDEENSKIRVGGYVSGGAASDDIFLATFGNFSIGGGADVLPPYIIYRILTSDVFGVGVPESAIDQSSYQLALQYCDAEDIRVSVQYRREENVLSIIGELLALYGGFLIDSGGKIKFSLQQFTTDPVRTIDNDHLRVDNEGELPTRTTKGARQDTYNKIKVNYFDRDLEYRQNFVEIGDEVDQDINGVRPREFPPKFVMKEGTANKIAVRGLWGNLYGRDIHDFKLGPKDADLEPGDVITLVDSFSAQLKFGKQVRIVVWQEREPLKFVVRAVDEIKYINESSLAPNSSQQSTYNEIFGPSAPAADFVMYELPKEFQGANAQTYVGYRQQSSTMGARLYVSADGESFTIIDDRQPYIISGILANELPDRPPGYFEENVEVYLMPDTRSADFNPDSPTYAQTHALDDVNANGRALGAGNLWAGSEMLAYENVTLLGQNHYRFGKLYRGWGGTHIQPHNSGETFHKHGGGVFNNPYNEDAIGSIIHYKVAPYNFAGVEYDIASVDARTYQVQGTFFRPQNQAPIRTFVQSPGSFLTVQSEDLGFIRRKEVVSGGSTVRFEWPDSNRDRGYGAQGYGLGGYGRFSPDTTSTQWRVEVLSSDLSTVVRCTTVSTTAFEYDTLTNSGDWNGWNGSFAVKVTPFNELGDAIRGRTKILELFE